MATIFVDSREKSRAIKRILATFDSNGVNYVSNKLYVGDYQRLDNALLVVDRKQNLLELCQNVCQDHKRFAKELARAQESGIHIVFLCEHGKDITCLEDVLRWENPRIKESPMAMSGERLYKVLSAMAKKYDTEFRFCTKAQTGTEILKILGVI